MKWGDAGTPVRVLKLPGTQTERQFGADPRGPLLDVVLMVLVGELQFRVQRMDADLTPVAVSTAGGE